MDRYNLNLILPRANMKDGEKRFSPDPVNEFFLSPLLFSSQFLLVASNSKRERESGKEKSSLRERERERKPTIMIRKEEKKEIRFFEGEE